MESVMIDRGGRDQGLYNKGSGEANVATAKNIQCTMIISLLKNFSLSKIKFRDEIQTEYLCDVW